MASQLQTAVTMRIVGIQVMVGALGLSCGGDPPSALDASLDGALVGTATLLVDERTSEFWVFSSDRDGRLLTAEKSLGGEVVLELQAGGMVSFLDADLGLLTTFANVQLGDQLIWIPSEGASGEEITVSAPSLPNATDYTFFACNSSATSTQEPTATLRVPPTCYESGSLEVIAFVKEDPIDLGGYARREVPAEPLPPEVVLAEWDDDWEEHPVDVTGPAGTTTLTGLLGFQEGPLQFRTPSQYLSSGPGSIKSPPVTTDPLWLRALAFGSRNTFEISGHSSSIGALDWLEPFQNVMLTHSDSSPLSVSWFTLDQGDAVYIFFHTDDFVWEIIAPPTTFTVPLPEFPPDPAIGALDPEGSAAIIALHDFDDTDGYEALISAGRATWLRFGTRQSSALGDFVLAGGTWKHVYLHTFYTAAR